MKKNKTTARFEKKDIFQQITNMVISEMEKGNVIWQQPWNGYGAPKNIIAGNLYRGWNSLFLNFITGSYGFNAPYFLTFKQAQAQGGKIRKGEKGFPVVYWLQYNRELPEDAEPAAETADVTGTVYRVPKYYKVFNLDQTEGIDVELPALRRVLPEAERIARCEAIVSNMPACPKIEHQGNHACYLPQQDRVVVPPFACFHRASAYYNTLFHELAHSTGHTSRLNRPELMAEAEFGDNDYSKEELIAEFTASFLCGSSGIDREYRNNAAYLNNWLSELKNDRTLLFGAAAKAQLAADYILNVQNSAESAQRALSAAA